MTRSWRWALLELDLVRLNRTGCLNDCRGASAVEFALIAPLVLLLVLGALAYGIYFGAAHAVQQLAADAARAAVAGLSADERTALATAFIANNGAAYVLLDPERLTLDAAPSPADPDQFLVSLSYDATALPIWNLYPPLPLPDGQIVFSSTIRNGGV